MSHKIVIYGAGGLGREILCLILKGLAQWNPLGFIDDTVPDGTIINGLPVLPKSFLYNCTEKTAVVMGFANTHAKKIIYDKLKGLKNIYFPVIIAPTALVVPDAHLEEGVVIANFCSISTNVRIGCCSFFNTGTLIGHDSTIGNFVSAMPLCSISGNVSIGDETLIGAQSFILQGISIGSRSIISAGSKVFCNMSSNITVLGNPAYVLKSNSDAK